MNSGDSSDASAGRVHRVLLIGAGAISEHHALAISRTPNASLAGFFDVHRGRAAERATRFGVRNYDSISEAASDGVTAAHVLVPPAFHASQALEAIACGMHVLVEKPLATTEEDCKAIAEAARLRGVQVTVGHSLLFDPEIVRARKIVRSGSLGSVIGVDVIRSSQYPSFAGGNLPAHYALAGEGFRDLGVHALYLVSEFLGEIRGVSAMHRSMGGDPLLPYDEWSCTVDCERGIANVRLSWNARPMQSIVLLHGTGGMLRIDLFHMFLAFRRQRRLPQAAIRVINTLSDSVRPMWEMPANTMRFLLKRRRQFQGIHGLIQDFYGRLARDEAPAISVDDGAAVVKWTEFVAREAERTYVGWNQSHPCSSTCDVLVTGGAGKLGRAVVAELARCGRRVRVLSRRPPLGPLAAGVEYFVGDLGDPQAVDAAVAGADVVVHAGAAMSGDADRNRGSTVVGTQNILDAVQRHGCRRLVHISSLIIVDWAGNDRAGPVNEDAPYEPHPELRGLYTQSKLESERLVRAAVASSKVDVVILRPGQIWGGDQPLMTDVVARRAGLFNIVLGNGQLRLPLVHVEDVVQAVLKSISAPVDSGTILQLVSPWPVTQNDVLKLCNPGGITLRLPRWLVFGLGWLSERVLGWLGRKSPFSVYRIRSALARFHFDSDRAQRMLNWTARVDARQQAVSAAPRVPVS